MSLRTHIKAKPSVCPVCGESYHARTPKKLDDKMKVSKLHRHRTRCYVYLHWNDYSPMDR